MNHQKRKEHKKIRGIIVIFLIISVILSISSFVFSLFDKSISLEPKLPISTLTSHPTLEQPTETFIPLPTPTVEIKIHVGDSISDFLVDKSNLSLTLLTWRGSLITVDGPYVGEKYYTFTAKPGMKFVVIVFEIQNNDVRPHYGPILSNGEIITNKEYYYPMWDPPLGVHSDEYFPRLSTEFEIDEFVGTSKRVYGEILQEESVTGYWVFEIPEDQTPIEATVLGVPYAIVINGD